MSNTKKTDRKNMTNQVVTWPSADTYFTVESLLEKNSHIKAITLRVKLNKSIDEGNIARLGTIHGGKGRPKVASQTRHLNLLGVMKCCWRNVIQQSML